MGLFRDCCLKGNPNEVDYESVEEMDWFELTLGKVPVDTNFPSGKNLPSELYQRLVNPTSDETVKKIVKSMGKVNHENALRALASPFMQVVDTVKYEVAKTKDKSSEIWVDNSPVLKHNSELVSKLVADPKLNTMRKVLKKLTPNLKRLLLNWRYNMKCDDLQKEIQSRFLLDSVETREENLERILLFLNRLTEFVVYLHKNCTYKSASRSIWHKAQLDEINKAAIYYRGLYVTLNFNSRRGNFFLESRSEMITDSMRLMEKYPESLRFISCSAPLLYKLGLIHPCANIDYWPAYFNVDLLKKWNSLLAPEQGIFSLVKHKFFTQTYVGVYGLNVWIYAMLYLRSLSLKRCGVPAEIAQLLKVLKREVQRLTPSSILLKWTSRPILFSLFREFSETPINENDAFGRKMNNGVVVIQHIEKMCKHIMAKSKFSMHANKQKPHGTKNRPIGGSASESSSNGDKTSEERSSDID